MKVIFLDTNIFIQCRDLDQLPWAEVFGKEEPLLLLIPRTVQEEIDRQKQDGNSRRAKRARKASSFFKKILLEEKETLCIHDSNPTIYISFTPQLKLNHELPDILDRSRPDDQIIAELINYKFHNPHTDVLLLTHDTNPILTAKHCELPYQVIPDDWLLPPEPDSREKKIIKLEEQIKELQNVYPVIEASWADSAGHEINELSLEIVHYKDLEFGEIDKLLNTAKQRYPMEINYIDKSPLKSFKILNNQITLNDISLLERKYIPPTDKEITKYQNEEYPNWIEEIKKNLSTLHEKLESPTRYASFFIKISNTGNVPAENIIVKFKALKGILFSPIQKETDADERGNVNFPSPPKPPKGHWMTRYNSIANRVNFLKSNFDTIKGHTELKIPPGPIRRDPNEFYWKNGRPKEPVTYWAFECEEFRHKSDPEPFDIGVLIPPDNDIGNGVIECSISARNLRDPLKYYFHLSITHTKGDTFSEAMNLINTIKPM